MKKFNKKDILKHFIWNDSECLEIKFEKTSINIDTNFSLKAVIQTIGCIFLICCLWMGLEMFFYGMIQNRIVDNILLLVLIPFIFKYFKMKDILNKKNEKE